MVPELILLPDRLLPGGGAAAIERPAVRVRDGHVVDVVPAPVPDALREAGRTVRLAGATLLPGLIDAHVHLDLPGDGSPVLDLLRQSDATVSAVALRNAGDALAAGITTVRDCGGRATLNVDLRDAVEAYGIRAARIVSCGPPVTVTGGHCWFFGGEADGVETLRRTVRDLVRRGVDFIKVMASGGGTPRTLSWRPAYRQEELDAIVEEAHAHGLKASAHCLCAESTLRAVRAGFDVVEHAGFLADAEGNQAFDPEAAAVLVEAGVAVCPTLAVGRYVLRTLGTEGVADDAAMRERWTRMLEQNVAQLGRMLDAGLRVIAGTDAGWRWTPFDALVDELELMAEAGLPTAAALESATSGAADALGLEGLGRVAPGAPADLLAVRGRPDDDLAALREVELVVRRGRIVHERGAPAEVPA